MKKKELGYERDEIEKIKRLNKRLGFLKTGYSAKIMQGELEPKS